MFKSWISAANLTNYTSHHPEVVALESALKTLRIANGQTRSAPLSSIARILLPFQVHENNVTTSIVGCEDKDESSRSTCMVLLVRLFAVENVIYDDPNTKKPK